MEDWRIKDYKILCYNLQNKIKPFSADMRVIVKDAKRIKRKEKCDELTALKLLKKQLESKIIKK